jgi:hypothetical protein
MSSWVSGPDRSAGAIPEGRRSQNGDLYEVLEVSPRASHVVIHAAYRALVRSCHPDHDPSAEASRRIRQLNAAYRVLSDPQGRARYDLEAARSRRAERLSHAATTATATTTIASGQPHSLSLRPAPPRRSAEERTPLLGGQMMLGLVAVVALAIIVIVLLWVSFDPDTDLISVYPTSPGELIRH